MNEINDWLARQARRERSVVRLEDALLGNRLARYFVYRLRFFVARAAISTVFRAIKIVLLLGAFPRAEFVAMIVLQATFALGTDFWWGALEELRGRVRTLQRRAARHLIPREIARWLTMSAAISLIGLAVALGYAAFRLLSGGLEPVDAFIVALVIGAALDVTTRAYHSGAYALRRVYRPLPSLLALDVVSVGVLLACWPLIGIWAFPLAELLSALTVAAISIRYTSRAYRTLAIPTLLPLLRQRRPMPGAVSLRAGLAPGIAYALVGLEALVVIAGVASATSSGGTTLIALLAALAPINRAGFEWARLLYFDLKKMDVQLLADLRTRFDRAARRVALLMGVVTWVVAAAAVAIVVGLSVPLLLALLLLFVARSLLAGEQMQAFTGQAYARLAVVGLLGVLGVLGAFLAFEQAEARIATVSAVLAASFVVLLILPGGRDDGDALLPPSEWLRRLRGVAGPVTVTRHSFDDRVSARGTPVEARRAEAWRRGSVAKRLARQMAWRRGATAWLTPTELWSFEPGASSAESVVLGLSSGLLVEAPAVDAYADGSAAARVLVGAALDLWPDNERRPVADASADPAALLADFARRFPTGIGYDLRLPAPAALAAMAPGLRGEIYRAALVFARDLRRGRGPDGLEVSALTVDGVLRAVFVVDRRESPAVRRAWRHRVRRWTLISAALGPRPVVALAADANPSPQEARML